MIIIFTFQRKMAQHIKYLNYEFLPAKANLEYKFKLIDVEEAKNNITSLKK